MSLKQDTVSRNYFTEGQIDSFKNTLNIYLLSFLCDFFSQSGSCGLSEEVLKWNRRREGKMERETLE